MVGFLKTVGLICLIFTVSMTWSATPVEKHGQLRVSGTELQDKNGQAIQLRGMSLFWSQWGGDFYNSGVVNTLADDWNSNLIRAAMGQAGDEGKIRTVVDAAIAKGIYVIIDWHSHDIQTSQAISFFETMAREYGDHPNVIYEIFNEPIDQSWDQVRQYSIQVVNAIRAIDPDNVILIGSPNWSQDVDIAAENPVPGTNLAYTLHFYAGTHEAWLRTKAQTALGKGLALFVTEWGTSVADGGTSDRNVFEDESTVWLNWLDQRKISWANWSIMDKDEASAALVGGASKTGGWSNSNLTQSGRYVRNRLNSYEDVFAEASTDPGGDPVVSTGNLGGMGEWGVYVDTIGSSVTPPKGESPIQGEGGNQIARADMTIMAEPEWEEGVELEYPFVGMMVHFADTGVLSTSSEIVISYKSSGNIRMGFLQLGISEEGGEKEGQEWGAFLPPPPTATEEKVYTIPFSFLSQPEWLSMDDATPLDMSKIWGIKWELRPSVSGVEEGFLEITGITFDDAFTDLTTNVQFGSVADTRNSVRYNAGSQFFVINQHSQSGTFQAFDSQGKLLLNKTLSAGTNLVEIPKHQGVVHVRHSAGGTAHSQTYVME